MRLFSGQIRYLFLSSASKSSQYWLNPVTYILECYTLHLQFEFCKADQVGGCEMPQHLNSKEKPVHILSENGNVSS